MLKKGTSSSNQVDQPLKIKREWSPSTKDKEEIHKSAKNATQMMRV